MRFNSLYYKKFFLQEKREIFRIKDIKKSDGDYIIECFDRERNNLEIPYDKRIHKLYENKFVKSLDQIKDYFLTEDGDGGISTGDAGVGGTGGQFSSDFYATGDARNPLGGGGSKWPTQRRNLKGMENLFLGKKKRKKKRSKIKKKKTK